MRTLHTRLATAALATGLVLGVSACGQAAEKAAEQAAEQAIGGDVDVNDGNVTVKDGEGNEVSLGENVELPADWPSAVPAVEGGTLTMAGLDGDGGASAMWQVDADPETASTAYASQLESAGFTKDAEAMLDEAAMRQFLGNGLRVSVSATESDGATAVLVVVRTEESSG